MGRYFLFTMMVIMVAGTVYGADAFDSSLVFGVTLTDGNSETLLANAALLTKGGDEAQASLRAGVEANYGESKTDGQTDTTVENAKAFAHTRKTLSKRTFTYLGAVAIYDDIAEIDYRSTAGPGIGLYFIKTDVTELSLEAGPAYVWEKVAGVRDDYPVLRVEQRFEHALSETARIWQSVEYLPETEDLADNYLINAELGAEAAMNARVKLRLVLQNEYESIPAAGLEKNDLTLISGISVNW